MMNRIYKILVLALMCVGISACSSPRVVVIGELDQRPGNPAVTSDGTVYFTMHPFDAPEFKVMRLEDGKPTPYPNKEISSSYAAVIGIQATKDGTLWWLDMGGTDLSAKLVGWDTKGNTLKAEYIIPPEASVANSFHQDFCIDEKRGKAFVADMSRGGMIDKSDPAIVVIDLKNGEARRILSGNDVFQPSETPIIAEGKAMQMKDAEGKVHEIKLGLNPITIDPSNDWVYFSTMTPGKLYRVPAEVLGDFAKPEAEIEKAIEVYADKPSSDGIAAGAEGRIYITNVDKSSIDVADASGTRTWSADPRMVWPDGVYVAPDGSVVATINQLNRAAAFNDGEGGEQKPYLLIRISE